MPKNNNSDFWPIRFHEILGKYYRQDLMTHAGVFVGFLGRSSSYITLETEKNENESVEKFFDLASLTKAFVTTPLVHKYLIENEINLDTSLANILCDRELPKFLGSLSIEELLMHRSGLPAWRNFWVNRLTPTTTNADCRRDALQHIAKVFSRYDASLIQKKEDLYSDLNFILLGYFLEKSTGRSLEDNFEQFLTEMKLDRFRAPFFAAKANFAKSNYISTAWCPLRERVLCGEVHDENAAALGGVAGHSGLFGSLDQVTWLLEKLVTTEIGKKIIGQITAGKFLSGWRLGADEASIQFLGGKAIGHYGFTGTAFWLEPATNACVVLLTNRVCSGRINPLIRELRKEIFFNASEYLASIGPK